MLDLLIFYWCFTGVFFLGMVFKSIKDESIWLIVMIVIYCFVFGGIILPVSLGSLIEDVKYIREYIELCKTQKQEKTID